ncbi:E4 [Procyon lotor papillomavirus 1]|uniref:E4 n=1 Tax=Procyon lotor papillomavirus 1 TaxID=312349 RepID=Q4QW00_9PAPI|nr:E4 [Procyon lotor papillomavirus 1]AAW88325.1 E4 [Procyon lotor papillomavirus 1]
MRPRDMAHLASMRCYMNLRNLFPPAPRPDLLGPPVTAPPWAPNPELAPPGKRSPIDDADDESPASRSRPPSRREESKHRPQGWWLQLQKKWGEVIDRWEEDLEQDLKGLFSRPETLQ